MLKTNELGCSFRSGPIVCVLLATRQEAVTNLDGARIAQAGQKNLSKFCPGRMDRQAGETVTAFERPLVDIDVLQLEVRQIDECIPHFDAFHARRLPLGEELSHAVGGGCQRGEPLVLGQQDLMTTSAFRRYGPQTVPTEVTFDTADDLAAFIDRTEDLLSLREQVQLARNVVPEWCSFTAEVRSQDERKAIELAREMVESAAFAASLADCEVESEVRPSFPGYRFRESDPPVRIAAQALERAGYAPSYALSGGGADANVFNARGLECVNLANGMTDIHTPDEHIAVDDLERMVDVTLALVDVAREQ
jgi:hypothetical protein